MKTFLKFLEEFFPFFMRIAIEIGRRNSGPCDKSVVLIMMKYASAIHGVNFTEVPWMSDCERL